MKKILLLLSFAFVTGFSFAQIGITAGYTSLDAADWEFEFQQEFGLENQLFVGGSRVGINYWLRLKKVRIEFFPSLEYADYGTQIGNETTINRTDYDANFIGAFLHTRIYPFDFINDCNCPTFSKQNETFKKGFFVMLSTGAENMQTSVTRRLEDNIIKSENSEWKTSLGGGIGLDIGVSDFLTLTPMIGARYSSAVNGDHLMTDKVIGDDFSDLFQFFGGINIGLRFNN